MTARDDQTVESGVRIPDTVPDVPLPASNDFDTVTATL